MTQTETPEDLQRSALRAAQEANEYAVRADAADTAPRRYNEQTSRHAAVAWEHAAAAITAAEQATHALRSGLLDGLLEFAGEARAEAEAARAAMTQVVALVGPPDRVHLARAYAARAQALVMDAQDGADVSGSEVAKKAAAEARYAAEQATEAGLLGEVGTANAQCRSALAWALVASTN